MDDSDFNELAGRIEGIGLAVMYLAAMLETDGTINGRRYSASLHRAGKKACFPKPYLSATKRTLQDIAKALDGACKQRQLLDGQN